MPVPRAQQPPPRIQIERTEPIVDCGRYPIKRTVGESVTVAADVFRDGHEALRAVVRYRGPAGGRWREAPMHWIDPEGGGNRWSGTFGVDACG